ncbi:GlsB/YeaQ/YmgE family stress response membrane protein [Pseudonocardia sp. RS010]|uniref:GlsB/YeaQ/YmgE family stress response membrane protein n=1 Tax=Pseudonocardia sp. RS010 TaxID=3385979 RepID=UPI0039A188B0
MTITGIISAIVIGLVIGALGRLVVPGKQRIPIWLTILIGIVAAFVGSFIAGAFGYSNAGGGFPWVLFLIQIAVAAVGVAIAAGAYDGRRRRGLLRR